MKKIFILLTLSILISSSGTFNASAQKTKAAETIKKMFTEKTLPDITLMDINGKKVNVAEYSKKGKLIVFTFWATWCIPCKKELSDIDKVYEEWQKKYDVEVVAVSIDDSRASAKVKSTVLGEEWPYEVLLDVNSDLRRAVGAQTVPFTAMVDKEGHIVYTHQGYVEGGLEELEKEIAKYAAK